MSQGFTRTQIMNGLVRDVNAASPACFESNLTAGSAQARLGTSLTAHATPHTKAASYTTLIASTAQIVHGIWVAGFDVEVSATATGQLLDIATGAASAEVDIISNIDMGAACFSGGGTQTSNGKIFYFPGLSIPASTRISARIQALITVDLLSVAITLDNRIQWQIANTSWVTYGADTANSTGTSVPRAANTFGAWTQIGTTSRNHNLWTVGMDLLADTTEAAQTVLIEIGYGPNAGSVTSIGVVQCPTATIEGVAGVFPPVLAFVVASGSILWARLAGADTENRGIIIYGN